MGPVRGPVSIYKGVHTVVPNTNTQLSEYLNLGGRRKGDRRQPETERRGILRWDPSMKNRRSGEDRRDGFSGKTRER